MIYPPYSKYKAHKVVVNGIKFDSKKEAKRYKDLLLLEQAGTIKDLQRQVKYVLIPAQYAPDIIGKRGGHKRGKLLERECSYVADFVYTDTESGQTVVEDVKGFRTEVYKIKKKLLLERYGIQIKEV